MSDLISRDSAYATVLAMYVRCDTGDIEDYRDLMCESILMLPSAQPEIIRCQKCKFASGDSRICTKFGHSPIGELDFCAWAERKTDE